MYLFMSGVTGSLARGMCLSVILIALTAFMTWFELSGMVLYPHNLKNVLMWARVLVMVPTTLPCATRYSRYQQIWCGSGSEYLMLMC